MTRPEILTETQLRAAVAVAEAQRWLSEAGAHVGKLGCDIMNRPEFDHVKDWGERYDAAKPARLASDEWVAADTAYRAADAANSEAVLEWMKLRPSGPFEVRAGETLARIVADHTDGGAEPIWTVRDAMLSEILREFEGLTPRDGVR